MKFFKYGDAVAIVLPEPLQKASGVADGDEYEFFQVEPGVFILMSRGKIEESSKREALTKLAQKILPEPTKAAAASPPGSPVPSVARQGAPLGYRPQPSIQSDFKPGSQEALLQANGFVVLDNESQAKQIHFSLEKSIKAGMVRGTRGFDKKYYIIHSSLFDSISPRIVRCLESKKEATLEEIVSGSNAAPQAVLAVLNLMKEDGDLLEKRRGVYSLVT